MQNKGYTGCFSCRGRRKLFGPLNIAKHFGQVPRKEIFLELCFLDPELCKLAAVSIVSSTGLTQQELLRSRIMVYFSQLAFDFVP